LAAGLPRQDHVYRITDDLLRFHNQKIDGMCCKLDSTENMRSFEKYPTPPSKKQQKQNKTNHINKQTNIHTINPTKKLPFTRLT